MKPKFSQFTIHSQKGDIMIELKGKRNTAIIYADKIDKVAKTQLAELLRDSAYADGKIRIMPDVHASRGTVVGTAMTLNGRVSPSLMGVDIGCGVDTVNLGKIAPPDLQKLDRLIHLQIPAGAKIRRNALNTAINLEALHCASAVNIERAVLSLGTLGGGNHFIELDRDGEGNYYLVIHTGSRQLGSDVATYYAKQAYKYQCGKQKRNTPKRYGEEEGGFQPRGGKLAASKPRAEGSVLEGELFLKYLNDTVITADFAAENRKTIANIICEGMGFSPVSSFSCPHNFIDAERMILRKGSISARAGEQVIIPLNMRDGAIIGEGLGEPEWNFSAPHGAGRICTRDEARYTYTVEEYRSEMAGIYTSTANADTLDECPMAYKPSERITEAIGDTVRVLKVIKPVYNFKGA